MLPITTSIMATLFVAVGVITIFMMFEMFASNKSNTNRPVWKYTNIFCGYLFISLYIIILFFMINKATVIQKELTARAVIHIVLSLSLIPLLAIKIAIVKRYHKLGGKLPMIGITIFIVAFVLTGITAGYYALHHSNLTYTTIASLKNGLLDLELGKSTTNSKCNKCHSLERVYLAHKTDEGWSSTINKMALLDSPNITSFDVKQTLNYLIHQQKKRAIESNLNFKTEIGKTLVSQKCNICHDLDRVFGAKKDNQEWLVTINRMSENMGDPNFLTEQEKTDLISFLTEK